MLEIELDLDDVTISAGNPTFVRCGRRSWQSPCPQPGFCGFYACSLMKTRAATS